MLLQLNKLLLHPFYGGYYFNLPRKKLSFVFIYINNRNQQNIKSYRMKNIKEVRLFLVTSAKLKTHPFGASTMCEFYMYLSIPQNYNNTYFV